MTYNHPWQRDAQEAVNRSRNIGKGDALVLAYQFEQAKAENPNGFTLDTDGRLYQEAKGYAVGLTVDSFTNVADALDTLARLQEQYGFRNLYLGYWRDEETQVEYVDVTMITLSFEMAMRIGARQQQIAIWDFQFGRAVRLDDERWTEGLAR